MRKREDRNTRYYIDIDLKKLTILKWDFDQRDSLSKQNPAHPHHHRIFVTRGQYNKLNKKHGEL